MSKLVFDESNMIEANLREYESRTQSPLNRFLESTPTFVTYWHINNPESTADVGFHDLQQLLGRDSPLRFNKISKFPIYGIEQILPSLQQTDFGLDIDFSSTGIILPNTIEPCPNDWFMIEHLHSIYIFVVTEIAYDTMRPDGYYQITFKIQYTDQESFKSLNNQTIESNVCVLENIGTEKNPIILDSEYDIVQALNRMTSAMAESYISLFYSQRHNCFLGKINEFNRYFDQYLHSFLRHTNILSEDNSPSVIYTPNKIDDKHRSRKYLSTVWSWLERGHPLDKFEEFPFDIHKGVDYRRSSFERYLEMDIMVSDILFPMNKTTQFFFQKAFVDDVRNNHLDDYGVWMKTLARFIRGDIPNLSSIPTNLEYYLMDSNDPLTIYQTTPIIIFFIKEAILTKLKLVNAI